MILEVTGNSLTSNNMNRTIFFLLFFASFNLFSEEIDTNKVFRLKQLNIEDSRIVSQKELEFSAINILTRSDIERSNYFQISEIISKSPGVFIKNYGGLGGLKTVTLRGTNSMQTVVAFDGIPLNSIQNGSFDLTGIPLSIIDKVEVTRGGASSSFGSNSIAGAINFIPKIVDRNELELFVKHTSFAETQVMSSYNFKISSVKNSINIDWTNGPGDYPFEYLQFGEKKTVRRNNNYFKNFAISYSNEFLDSISNFRNTIIYEKSKRGVPGAILQGRIESTKANLSEQKVFAKSSYDYFQLENFLAGLDAAYRYSYMQFIDPELPSMNGIGTSNIFATNDFIFQAKIGFNFENNEIFLRTGTNCSLLEGDMLDPKAGAKVHRLNLFITVSYSNVLYLFNSKITSNISSRADFFDDGGPSLSPSIGLKIDYDYVYLKILNSFNYRKPSFNEMYYLNYGTKDLRPEKSSNYTITFGSNYLEKVQVDFSAFLIETRDQIIAIPKSPISWSAANIDKVEHKGLELSLLGKYSEIFLEKIGFNWTLQSSINKTKSSLFYNKQLILTPQEIINGYILMNFQYLKFSVDFDYTSFRYTDPENNNNSILPKYLLLDFGIIIPIEIKEKELNVVMDCKNVLDKQYEIIPNYPMPKRQFIVGLNIKY